VTYFNPGDSVAFVDDTNLGTLGYGDEVYPTLNETYTVRDVVLDHFGAEGLLLHEIKNDRLPYRVGAEIVDTEKSFASWRFRPLVGGEKKKEMEAV
jgi:hypothetical protein